jgi:hypothetical protein
VHVLFVGVVLEESEGYFDEKVPVTRAFGKMSETSGVEWSLGDRHHRLGRRDGLCEFGGAPLSP